MKLLSNNFIGNKIVSYWQQEISNILKIAKRDKTFRLGPKDDRDKYQKSIKILPKVNIQIFLTKNKNRQIRLCNINNILFPSIYGFFEIEAKSDFKFFHILHAFSHLDTKISMVGKMTFEIKSHFIGDFLLLQPSSQDEKLLYLYLLENQVNFLFSRDYSTSNLKKTKNKNIVGRELILFVFCTLFVTKTNNFPELESKIKAKFQDRWQYLEMTELNFNLFGTYLLDGFNMLEKSLESSYKNTSISKIKLAFDKCKFTREFGDILFSNKNELEKMQDLNLFILQEVVQVLG